MGKQGNTSSTSLIKFLLVIFRGIFFLYAIGLILYVIISTISLTTRNQQQHTSLPVMFRLTDTGNLISSKSESISTFHIYYATGFIGTESLPGSARVFSMFVSILISICVLLIIKLICQILEAAKTGDFLVVKNAIRMRHMALLFIMVFFIDKLYLFISSSYLSDKLDFQGVGFIRIHYYGLARWEYIFFYLFLLVVAEAFRIGAQLKHENDLTI